MKKQAGISLIETMVTLFIVSILLSYAIPNFKDFLLRQSLTTKANDMLVDLVFTRAAAINQGIPVRISANPTWVEGWQVITDIDGDGLFNGADQVLRKVNKVEENIQLIDGLGDDIPIIFGVTGSLRAPDPREITIKHTDVSESKTLRISLSGSISVR